MAPLPRVAVTDLPNVVGRHLKLHLTKPETNTAETFSSTSGSSRSASPTDFPSESDVEAVRSIFVPSLKADTADTLNTIVSEGGCIAVLVKHSDGYENTVSFVKNAMSFAKSAGVWNGKPTGTIEKTGTLSYLVTTDDNPNGDQTLPTEGDKITSAEALNIFSAAFLRSILSVPSPSNTHTLYILEKPTVSFPPLSSSLVLPSYKNAVAATAFGIPTRQEWAQLWKAWDLVTLGMIPQDMLLQKPIDLRHKCLFYIGHIPTFVDMLLHKSVGGGASEPAYFWNIFERGIDPHVDDPDHCHNHSEVPTEDKDWPSIGTVLAFRDRVRARLFKLYDELESGERQVTRNIARTLVMTFEHEAFHVETLLYMLLQRAGNGTLPPPGFSAPPWAALKAQWEATPSPSTTSVILGPTTIIMGHQDSELEDFKPEFQHDVEDHVFGWDNESPPRAVDVRKFRAEWRPVTNGEFETYWKGEGRGKVAMPKSWVEEDGEVKVRTMHGPVPIGIASTWPVLTSYDDMAVYAKSKGGRLPTEPELRLFLDTYNVGHSEGANVGFRNWHPVAATAGLEENGGRGSNGGIWEWTSTAFEGHEGLAPTNLFTGYSTDFFDTKHNVILGASYATIPRLSDRRTVRNFYQHNYPYPWVGARVVYDA